MDRERVINALESAIELSDIAGSVTVKTTPEVARRAVALLKEQEQDIQNLIADLDDLRKEHENLLDKKITLITSGQEVIRCKDCVWWGVERECENSYSPCFHNGCTHGNWFCADGERKE